MTSNTSTKRSSSSSRSSTKQSRSNSISSAASNASSAAGSSSSTTSVVTVTADARTCILKKVKFVSKPTYHEVESVPLEYKSDYFYTSEELKEYYDNEIESITRKIKKMKKKLAQRDGEDQPRDLLAESEEFSFRGLECWKPDATEDLKAKKKRRNKHTFAVVTKWRGLRAHRQKERIEELSLFSKDSSKQDRHHALSVGVADAKEQGYADKTKVLGSTTIRKTLNGSINAYRYFRRSMSIDSSGSTKGGKIGPGGQLDRSSTSSRSTKNLRV